MSRLKEILSKAENKKIAVIGDFCLDEYVLGRMHKISREGPIPVLRKISHVINPGAAGNTACAVYGLGGNSIPIGIIGADDNGIKLKNYFTNLGIDTTYLIQHKDITTHTYTKIVAAGFHSPKQQLLRIDSENNTPISKEIINSLFENLKTVINSIDSIIVADYSKGFVTQSLLKKIVSLAKEYSKLTVGDSREKINTFTDFDIVVPNDYEAVSAVEHISPETVEIEDTKKIRNAGNTLLNRLNSKAVVITRGKYGMTIFQENKITDIPTYAREVFDVTGAGDTVTAAITLSLSAEADIIEAAKIANYAAGIAVSKEGTAIVYKKELEDII